MEGAKVFRNITLAGAFWAGFAFLVVNAHAETSIYDSEGSVKAVSTTSGMNPGTVPQATTAASAGENANANSLGTQVQNVTVESDTASGAKANAAADNKNNAYQSVDNISKVRNETEQTHNALLLQQLELDRLKAEQGRLNAIQHFSATPEPAPATPCGLGPCVPQQQQPAAAPTPAIENNNVSIQETKVTAIDTPKEAPVNTLHVDEEESGHSWMEGVSLGITPIVGMRWFTGSSYASVRNLYLVGAGLNGEINKWVSVETNFIYGKDAISDYSFGKVDRDSMEFAGGVKVGEYFNQYLRPYVALGLGYIRQTYDIRWLNYNKSTNNIETNLGLGVDVKLSRNFLVGARGDYQFLFGSNSRFLANEFGDNSNRYRMGATATWLF